MEENQKAMEILYSNILLLNWKMIVMWIIGATLIYLAIKKEMEPTLLLPMGSVPSWSTCLSPVPSRRVKRSAH